MAVLGTHLVTTSLAPPFWGHLRSVTAPLWDLESLEFSPSLFPLISSQTPQMLLQRGFCQHRLVSCCPRSSDTGHHVPTDRPITLCQNNNEVGRDSSTPLPSLKQFQEVETSAPLHQDRFCCSDRGDVEEGPP
jgi:hypothetical protein